jgi:predicted dehydrogenase
MRFGLVGTGYWAEVTHGAVLVEHPDVDLVGVWGRGPQKTAAIAATLGTTPYSDFGLLLSEVDAVAFAVAPDVQGTMAIEAARAGKHLLLDKPLCISAHDADRLVDEVDKSGVSSVVFFTMRFADAGRQWLGTVSKQEWQGGWVRFIVSAFGPGSPYAGSPWRREKGALWDVGPHALSVLVGGLGPVTGVTAEGGQGDLVHLIFQHESGATSTATLTLDAPKAAITVEMTLWGPSGLTTLPRDTADTKVAYTTALNELLDNIRTGQRSHPCDVHFGAAVVHVLAEADAQIAKKRA